MQQLFFPYLVYAYLHATELTEGFWPKPGLTDIFRIDMQILIEPFLCLIFYSALIWAIIRTIKGDGKTGFLLWIILGYKVIDFIYSNLNGGYSMWIPRYFFCQLPVMMMLCGSFASELLYKAFSRGKLAAASAGVLACGCFLCLEFLFIRDLRNDRYPEIIHQPFEQTAEILRKQDDFWNPDTAFYYSAYNIEAWQYYLAHGDMTPGLFNLLPMDLEGIDLSPYQVIYVCELQNPIPDATWSKLMNNYECEELHHDYKLYRFTQKSAL